MLASSQPRAGIPESCEGDRSEAAGGGEPIKGVFRSRSHLGQLGLSFTGAPREIMWGAGQGGPKGGRRAWGLYPPASILTD